MKTRTIVEYLLAASIVLILGGLSGWYFFLRTQTQVTATQSAARGFGTAIPDRGADGSATPDTGIGGSPASSTRRPAQLWRVEAKPVAGQVFVGSENTLRLRYVERASGYVFEANPETGQITRLTNTLMPKIYEALLSGNGHIALRSLDAAGSITTFAGSISTSTAASSSTQTLLGSYLAKNIKSMSINPVSGALFFVVENPVGITGASADWNGAKQKTVFESKITNWRSAILGDGRTILVQAAADDVPGYGYELKKDGTMNPLVGPVPGLNLRVRPSSGSNGGGALLWSQSARGELRLFARVGENATAVQIPVRTIADKCAWTGSGAPVAYCGVPQGQPGRNFLDEWYRGSAHSSDALWRIDASAGTAEMIYTPPSNTSLDIEDIAVDSGEDYITFTNGADKSLWLFRLTK